MDHAEKKMCGIIYQCLHEDEADGYWMLFVGNYHLAGDFPKPVRIPFPRGSARDLILQIIFLRNQGCAQGEI
jgi:hypothetical protein